MQSREHNKTKSLAQSSHSSSASWLKLISRWLVPLRQMLVLFQWSLLACFCHFFYGAMVHVSAKARYAYSRWNSHPTRSSRAKVTVWDKATHVWAISGSNRNTQWCIPTRSWHAGFLATWTKWITNSWYKFYTTDNVPKVPQGSKGSKPTVNKVQAPMATTTLELCVTT